MSSNKHSRRGCAMCCVGFFFAVISLVHLISDYSYSTPYMGQPGTSQHIVNSIVVQENLTSTNSSTTSAGWFDSLQDIAVTSSNTILPAKCPNVTQSDRLRILYAWCKDNGFRYAPANRQPSVAGNDVKNIYVNDRYKVVYCHIPKAGCTNWKKYFILLSGKTNFTQVGQILGSQAHSKLFESSVRTLSSYTDAERDAILRTYFKFVFVRHPLTRLLSAYRNKFGKANAVFESFRQKILRYNYRYNSSNGSGRPQVTFSEFLRYMTDPEGKNVHLNEHWQSYQELCHPCSIRYDFVGQVETMAEDVRSVITKFEGSYAFPSQSSTSERYMGDMYARVPSTLTHRVIQKYSDDFYAFGYNC